MILGPESGIIADKKFRHPPDDRILVATVSKGTEIRNDLFVNLFSPGCLLQNHLISLLVKQPQICVLSRGNTVFPRLKRFCFCFPKAVKHRFHQLSGRLIGDRGTGKTGILFRQFSDNRQQFFHRIVHVRLLTEQVKKRLQKEIPVPPCFFRELPVFSAAAILHIIPVSGADCSCKTLQTRFFQIGD